MTGTPSITAFFPCYNDAGTIATIVITADRTLRGLTDDYEIIVGNDASTDNSRTAFHCRQHADSHEAAPRSDTFIHTKPFASDDARNMRPMTDKQIFSIAIVACEISDKVRGVKSLQINKICALDDFPFQFLMIEVHAGVQYSNFDVWDSFRYR